MAYYCIGNGSATIGGGSLGRTEQMPSLKLLCLDLCSRHLDRLSNLGDMPTEMFIDLLNRAKGKATPDLVQRLQDSNERLLCDDVDEAFWKRAVDEHIMRRMIPAPGPVLVERVNDRKERLTELIAETPETPSKEWSGEVIEILKALGEIPPSVGLLRETMIGKAVAPLRKKPDAQVSRLATDTIHFWKQAARTTTPDQRCLEALSSSPKARGGAGAGAVEDKQRAVEDGFNCRTWNALYKHLEVLREDKVRASSKRAREAREREQQKKPKLIFGKSRGEDFMKLKPGSGSRGAPAFELSRNKSKKSPIQGGSGIFSGSSKRVNKNINSNIRSNKNSSSSSSSSNTNKNSSSSSGGGSGGKSRRKNNYTSGDNATKISEIRRMVVTGQRLSNPAKGDRPAPKGAPPPAKQSKFWQ